MRTYLNLFLLIYLCVSTLYFSSCGGDESGLETFTEPVPAEGAIEIADHPDTESESSVFTMIPWDDSEIDTVIVLGYIHGVYSDGARKIEIHLRLGYKNREGKVIDKTVIPADRSVVFRYKKLTTEVWAKLFEDEKWAELMEGYITEDEFDDWEFEQRHK